MSLSHHAARAARVIGTSAAAAALCLGAAHTALACSISDFSAAAVCDGNGKGVIRVTDKDASGTPATVTLNVVLNQPINNERILDTKTIEHPTAQGTTVDLVPLDWYAGETFRVHVKAGDRVDDYIEPPVVLADTCKPSGTPSAPVTPPAHPSTAQASASPSSAAPTQPPSAAAAPSASNAPSPAGGGSGLAETGASSSTPVIAGVAVALVLAGGGTVIGLRRRTARRSH
ncbi:LAETG motif-containing sortase-dependent surface protein [Streptomyces sp. NPDC046931]|uniref:LAETG motif-containing sortase-dependent surface protein n=1 Tax=Streptomyces sp. NPDC046931 TaxID=3154806 RepID=UPI003407BD9C